MNEISLKSALEQIGTPSYIYDEDVFADRVKLVKEHFGERTGLCFSIKANPFLLKSLPEDFAHIEVCSPGELTICEKTGVDMKKIIFSGVNKTAEDVKRAVDDGVGVFTAESLLHVELINNAAKSAGKRVPLLIRLTGGSQFGMDESDFLSVVNSRDSLEGIEIVGIHYFTGTQKKKAKIIAKELDYLDSFIERVYTETGFKLDRVEYGTGLAVDYFTDEADELEKARLAETGEVIRAFAEKHNLTVEMGRFFAAPCGYYFTRVMDTKTNCDINYAIVDGGMNQLKYDGQLQGMQIPVLKHFKNSEKENKVEAEAWTLCGSLCTTADILARNAMFSDLEIGDTLVFCRTGAYSVMEGMAVFLSREMPKIAMYSQEKGLRVIRDLIYTDVFNTPV